MTAFRKTTILSTLLVALCAFPPLATAMPSCTGRHWVGVWSASPSDADPGSSRSLAGQTTRTLITPLGSGKKIRIELSNVLSSEPLTVDAATLARSAEGASVRGRSIEPLHFNGGRTVTIPAGGEVTSDRVRFKVAAFKRLAVSVDVSPSSKGIVTEHFLGRQTSYIATAGNEAATAGAEAFGETTTSRYLLSGLEVRAPRKVGAIATFGDSITDGFQGDVLPVNENPKGINQDVRYPDYLAHRLAHRRTQRLTILNAGISGNRIARDGLIPRMGPSGLARLDRDVFGLAGVRTVIVLEGINDIGQTPAGAAEVIDGLKQLVERLKDSGLRVLLGTLSPAGGTAIPTYGGPQANAIREQINAWVRSQTMSDGVIDFDAVLRDPADPSRLLPAFDSSDHLHPSEVGYRAMARAVPLRLLGARRCGKLTRPGTS